MDNNFKEIVEWFENVQWWIPYEVTKTTKEVGYTSAQRSLGNNNYEIIKLPVENNITTTNTYYKLNPAPVTAAIFVLIGVITVLGFVKRCIRR